MTNPDLNDLSLYYSDKFFIERTIEQIKKDLQLGEDELTLSEEDSYLFDQLVSKVQSVINYLLDKSFEQFLQCMYRIDINQKQLDNCIVNGNYDSKLIAETVVKRCLQKVVIKEWYKKNT
jgi:hypothetical protein